MPRIQLTEASAKSALDRLRKAPDGWPYSEAGWEVLLRDAREIVRQLELRNGLREIERQGRSE